MLLAEFVPVTVTFKSVLIWFPSYSIAGIVQLFDCWTCLYLYILGSVRWPHLLLMNNPRCNNPFLWTLLVPLLAFEQGHVWACLLGGVELVTIMSFIIEINEDLLAWACLLGGVELVTIMSFIIEINEDLLACLDLLKQYFFDQGQFCPKSTLK